MDPSGGRDRYNLGYGMGMMSETGEIYGNPNVSLARPPSGMGQLMGRGGGLLGSQNSQCGPGGGATNNNISSRGLKRTNSDCYDHERGGMGLNTNLSVLENCGGSGGGGGGGSAGGGSGGMTDVNVDDNYTALQQQNKKSPPSNGKKTKGRVKIKMEYIDNKLRRYTTFSKRKTGIMKKVSKNKIFIILFYFLPYDFQPNLKRQNLYKLRLRVTIQRFFFPLIILILYEILSAIYLLKILYALVPF